MAGFSSAASSPSASSAFLAVFLAGFFSAFTAVALSTTTAMAFWLFSWSFTCSAWRYFFTVSRSMPYWSAIRWNSASTSSSVASMFSSLMMAAMARSMRTCLRAGSLASASSWASSMPVAFMYWSYWRPCWASCILKLSRNWRDWASTMASGTSAVMFSATCSIRASSKARFTVSSRSAVIFFFRSAFRSFRVSNSLTSLANSSSRAGISFSFTSWTFTLNTTALPARSL